jgi:predicted amidophosphoribosyltransferase
MFSKKKDKKKKTLEEYIKENEGLVCENCRTPIPGNLNLCPKCGLSPSVDTMQSFYEPGQVRKLSEKRREEE